MRIGGPGFWIDSIGGPPPLRPPLPGPDQVDVAIIGAGYTGLWTAYYLKRADPSLRIAVLEAGFAGEGASGRNGGWITGFFSGPRRIYERVGGPLGVISMQRAMFATVDEVGRVVAAEGIDADFVKGGQLTVAMNDAQAERLRQRIRFERGWGFGEEDIRFLPGAELAERVRIPHAVGGTWTPHGARVHPAKLVTGLAAAVERLGASIYEQTPVLALHPHTAITSRGEMRAEWVVRATEGYTARLRGERRRLVPMNSSMIMTEPLSPNAWAAIGWDGYELMSDAAHAYVYMQHTADGRITIGGRGRPYRFGSVTDRVGDIPPSTVEGLKRILHGMLPAAAGTPISHAWSGVLGVPRDWGISANADPRSGIAWAGGYVGQGVAAANLAGRTLSDLIRGERTKLTELPWVGHSPRPWEPEPIRWLAIQSVYSLYRLADRIESRTGRPARLAAIVDAASGRH